MSYDLERLTPGGFVVDHLDMHEVTTFETDGPWLFLRGPDGIARRVLPSHAVVQVVECPGGELCGDTRTVR
jgi:hypothetical protein